MSFRWKVFLVSVAITVTIIVTTVGASRYFIHKGIQETILSDLSVMAKLAENLVSSDIELLKARAWTAVHQLERRDVSQWAEILKKQVESSGGLFLSISVFDRQWALASYGSIYTSDFINSPFAELARQGRTVISTTRRTPQGELVFNICVPLEGERVAAVTIPGMYFTDLVKDFQVWDTGGVFIQDNEGKTLAHTIPDYVREEYNVLRDNRDTVSVRSFKEYVRKTLTEGGEGEGRYTLDNKARLAYYKAVGSSNVGWILSVSAPLSESPLAYVDQGVILMTIIFLFLNFLCGWLISGFVDRQFNIINKQYANLSEMGEIAQKALEAKTNFLANMSHEMRTPLNAIIGFSDLMLCGRFDAQESIEGLDKIHAAGLILLGIVNDILDITKIESGDLELIEMEYELASAINDVVAVNLIRIGAKPIEFHVELDPTLPANLIGDELRIKQICSNILSNAFKYTHSGRVDLKVFGRTEEDKVWLSIQTRDTGVGIKKDDLEKLFSAYSQVDTTANRQIEGTGLGLSITRRMVEMMNGKIEVTSEYGVGSVFTVTVVQKKGKDGQLGVTSINGTYGSGSRGQTPQRHIIPMPYARILLVDDVQANLDVATGILKPYNMTIDSVTSGQEAVDLVKNAEKRYNAIFMDHMMPGMNGMEAVRIIREEIDSEYAKKVPIIALTANAIVGNEKVFLENGFQAYMTKPIDIHRMDLVLRQWVRDKDKESLLSPSELDPRSNEPARDDDSEIIDIPGLSVEKAMERFGGDKEVFLGVLRSYCSSVEELAPKLAEPSPEMLNDYTITVHGIKSSSYGVGANAVGDLARELESRSGSGDMDYILAHNQRFLSEVDTLVTRIREFLAPAKGAESPHKNAPDPELLAKMELAAKSYDMDGLEETLAELESFIYDNDNDLIHWLREKIDQAAFGEIVERLAGFLAKESNSKAEIHNHKHQTDEIASVRDSQEG
ncbi:MAG: response regulator [Deltaproteobacteria bacterium]|jgi:signal transduction histidine kinase/DNA-binding response OmpR family regulator|nr:response regulator [Deltaproteobacteria bacterium]